VCPDVEIVDPAALLGRSEPPQDAPIAAVARAEPAPVAESPWTPAARPVSRALTAGPGEEVLHALGGGAVLRRRRSSRAPKDAAE
jgi:hypothetical protein